MPESQLEFDPNLRRLTVAGGSRRDIKAEAALVSVIATLRECGEMTGRAIKNGPQGR